MAAYTNLTLSSSACARRKGETERERRRESVREGSDLPTLQRPLIRPSLPSCSPAHLSACLPAYPPSCQPALVVQAVLRMGAFPSVEGWVYIFSFSFSVSLYVNFVLFPLISCIFLSFGLSAFSFAFFLLWPVCFLSLLVSLFTAISLFFSSVFYVLLMSKYLHLIFFSYCNLSFFLLPHFSLL